MECKNSSLDFGSLPPHYAAFYLCMLGLSASTHVSYRGGASQGISRDSAMWKKNFLFRATDSTPMTESENELFHDTEPAMDSAGLTLDRFISVWIQGEGEDDKPEMFTNVYVRTATLDVAKQVGFLQPLQGRSHQIKQMLTPGQKQFLGQWFRTHAPQAWEASDDNFRELFEQA